MVFISFSKCPKDFWRVLLERLVYFLVSLQSLCHLSCQFYSTTNLGIDSSCTFFLFFATQYSLDNYMYALATAVITLSATSLTSTFSCFPGSHSSSCVSSVVHHLIRNLGFFQFLYFIKNDPLIINSDPLLL